MRIVLFVFITGLLFVGCEEKKDDKYTTCEIVSSTALLAENRERDENQCWTGGVQTDQDRALTWCRGKASDYCNAEYLICDQALGVRVSNDGC